MVRLLTRTFVSHLFQIQVQGVMPAHGKQPMRTSSLRFFSLTFDGDDMLTDLVLQQRLLDALQQLVDGVDVGVHRLEALDLGADGGRVGQVLLVVHGYQQLGGSLASLGPLPSLMCARPWQEGGCCWMRKVKAVTSRRRKQAGGGRGGGEP